MTYTVKVTDTDMLFICYNKESEVERLIQYPLKAIYRFEITVDSAQLYFNENVSTKSISDWREPLFSYLTSKGGDTFSFSTAK